MVVFCHTHMARGLSPRSNQTAYPGSRHKHTAFRGDPTKYSCMLESGGDPLQVDQ